VALVALDDVDRVVDLLSLVQESHGDVLNAFELIPRLAIDFVTKHIDGCTDPLDRPYPWYALIELTTGDEGSALTHQLESVLAKALDSALVRDGVIAQNGREATNIWRLREEISEVQKREGGSIKHDVSVPVQLIPAFIKEASQAVGQAIPGIRPVPFGHIGDGNIHFNLSQPTQMDGQAFLHMWDEFSRIVHDIVVDMDGSFSAEHGIGTLKRDDLARYGSATSHDVMARIKAALDPRGIMNPGKAIPDKPEH